MDAGEPSLPKRIKLPFHEHELVLRRQGTVDPSRSCCNACRNDLKKGDQIYACESFCRFKVDVACGSIKALVHYRAHEHPLCFTGRDHPKFALNCHACEKECDGPLFWCPSDSCSYGLHLFCGPLPSAIPYYRSGYDMNLILKDTILEGADPEDSWCDICEERREPGKCVYRSEDPLFTASTDCLLPQIVGALKGDLGEVQLRTVRGHVPGVVVPVSALQGFTVRKSPGVRSLLDDEAKEVIGKMKTDAEAAEVVNDVRGTFSGKQVMSSLTKEDQEHIGEAMFSNRLLERYFDSDAKEDVISFKFSDEAFELFNEHIAFNFTKADGSLITEWMPEMDSVQFIKVGNNLVPSEFALLYRQIINKHGDFTADSDSTLSPSARAVFLLWLMYSIHLMQGLQIFETTGSYLCEYQCLLELVRNGAGFKFQFALDNLEKVARARYALQLIKVREGITADLTQQIQQLERDIEDDKPELEALRLKHGRAKKESVFGEQCSAKTSKLQWKDAGEFLSLDPEE